MLVWTYLSFESKYELQKSTFAHVICSNLSNLSLQQYRLEQAPQQYGKSCVQFNSFVNVSLVIYETHCSIVKKTPLKLKFF